MIARYRNFRDVHGLSRRTSLVLLLPTRIHVTYAAILGRPVAYRLDIRNGVMVFDGVSGAIVAECRIAVRPDAD